MTHTSTEQQAAVKTLQNLGYTYHGGEQWKPPLGNAPDFTLIDHLHARVQELEASQAQRVPLSDAKVEELIHDKHFKKGCLQLRMESTNVNLSWYRLGLRDGEEAHGITQEKQG